MTAHATLKAGDWVEVRSQAEVLATLDPNGRLDGLPFMPEMLRFCGQRHRVSARAHRTCDTVDYVGGRGMDRTVHLEGLRCDGEAHGGCHALCMLFWKEAWLRPVDGPGVPARAATLPAPAGAGCTGEGLQRGTREPAEPVDHPNPTYVCQATKLLEATVPIRKSEWGYYVEDIASGNIRPVAMLGALAFQAFEYLVGGRYGIRTPLLWAYDRIQAARGGWPYPGRQGRIPKGGKTPSRRLDLQAGELVRVKTLPDILETVDENLRNRGMGFHTEMVPFTDRNYRVLRRIERIVNEKTGKMIHLKNDCVILEDVVCKGRYIDNCRRFCPRSTYLYFREIWLDRAEDPATARQHPAAHGAP